MKHTLRFVSLSGLLLVFALAACGSPPAPPGMKVGRPYVIDGITYYPEYDPTYDKIGEASWYGPGFHGKYTASGEIFDQNELTAAHPTLPMPSLVRVTNLSNGKSLIVRINDRGPFKANRIIDLSKKAADQLGMFSTAQVRVQYLKKETQAYIASLRGPSAKPLTMTAFNNNEEKIKNDFVMQSTEPPSSNQQIVEATDATTHSGQIVDSAAPVMSVREGNLGRPGPTASMQDKPDRPERTPGLVRDAAADENNAVPPVIKVAYQAPAAVANGKGYIIQAGSFSNEDRAHKLLDTLPNASDASIDKIQMNGKTWWRVRFGPFADKDDADDLLGQIRDAGLPDARIISQ